MAVTTTSTVAETCAAAKRAARATLGERPDRERKDAALEATARLLGERSAAILEANAADLADERAAGLTRRSARPAALTPERVAAMAEGVRVVAALPTRSARSSNGRRWTAASTCARCGCRWGSSPSSTRRART